MANSIPSAIEDHYILLERRIRLTRGGFIAVQFFLLLAVLTLLLLHRQYFPHLRDAVTPTCWLLVLTSLWAFYSWKRVCGTWFDPYSLFLLSAVVFNGSLAFLEVFHLDVLGPLEGRFRDGSIVPPLVGVAVGINAMHLGALLSSAKTARAVQSQGGGSEETDVRSLSIVGWCMLTVSAVPTVVVLLRSFSTVALGGYSSLYTQELSTGARGYVQVLYYFFVPSLLFLLGANNGRRLYVIFSTILLLLYSLSTLMLGWRYNAIAPVVAFLWVWDRTVSRVPIKLIVIGTALLVLFVFPLVGAVRNASLMDRLTISSLVEYYGSLENPSLAAISEMGGSLHALTYTMDLVPATMDYEMGLSYLYGLSTILPNLMWDIHPAIAHDTPSIWLTKCIDPYIAAHGGSLGFSFIAEAYLNFGLPGIPIVLFLIGFLFTRFVAWGGWSRDPAKIAVVGSYLAYFLFYSRSDCVDIVRPFFWSGIFPYSAILFIRLWRK